MCKVPEYLLTTCPLEQNDRIKSSRRPLAPRLIEQAFLEPAVHFRWSKMTGFSQQDDHSRPDLLSRPLWSLLTIFLGAK
jgi:hypothetical protein